ncbi:hypothetical protein [Bacillus mycoides]|uniref:hypothetical protein n=1 Tax=Bacillus mycoides TaxID=1405 RepID=UPI002112DE54|nr:hypothetical protein [Bacillus mycoides]MCQ6530806.1 hypothetical protein [Bacillus mycoides]
MCNETFNFGHTDTITLQKVCDQYEKGKEVGIQEGKIQLIRGMHKNGMDIAKFTNIDIAEVTYILGQ